MDIEQKILAKMEELKKEQEEILIEKEAKRRMDEAKLDQAILCADLKTIKEFAGKRCVPYRFKWSGGSEIISLANKARQFLDKKEDEENEKLDTVYIWSIGKNTYYRDGRHDVWEIGPNDTIGRWLGTVDNRKTFYRGYGEPCAPTIVIKKINTDFNVEDRKYLEERRKEEIYRRGENPCWSCPDDGCVYPWIYKGTKYLRNYSNEVWLSGPDKTLGEWQGIYIKTDDLIRSIPEPKWEE
jgi:hypothetical protein